MDASRQDESPQGAGEAAFQPRPLAGLASLAKSLGTALPSQSSPAEANARPRPPAATSPFAQAFQAKLVVAREHKGRGGKSVTCVRGLTGAEAVWERLAKELRHELGSGVRVEDGVLVVQGAMTERVAAALTRRGAARIVIGN